MKPDWKLIWLVMTALLMLIVSAWVLESGATALERVGLLWVGLSVTGFTSAVVGGFAIGCRHLCRLIAMGHEQESADLLVAKATREDFTREELRRVWK